MSLIKGQIACPCCGIRPNNGILKDLHVIVYVLSKFFASQVMAYVNSGYRCKKHHGKIYVELGYKKKNIPWNSYHLKGEAVDVRFVIVEGSKTIDPIVVACIIDKHLNYLKLTHIGGIGIMQYTSHLDRRDKHVHWIRKADNQYYYGVDFEKLRENKRKGINIYGEEL